MEPAHFSSIFFIGQVLSCHNLARTRHSVAEVGNLQVVNCHMCLVGEEM